MSAPEFQIIEAFRRNLEQRLPKYQGRVMLGRRAATKKSECPCVCVEYLTDITTPMSGSRGRQVEKSAHIQIAVYDWIEESVDIEERLLNEFARMGNSIDSIMRDIMLGKNCPDGFTLHTPGPRRGATASNSVNSTSRIVLYGYDFPSITFEATIGED